MQKWVVVKQPDSVPPVHTVHTLSHLIHIIALFANSAYLGPTQIIRHPPEGPPSLGVVLVNASNDLNQKNSLFVSDRSLKHQIADTADALDDNRSIRLDKHCLRLL